MPIPNLTYDKKKSIIEDIINDLDSAIDGLINIGEGNMAQDIENVINVLKEKENEN